MFETLLLEKLPAIQNFDTNQFGYQRKTSCKSAFFVANETIEYYSFGKSNMRVVSLDAAKAFDKLWRGGLFFKLKNVIDLVCWRILFKYYSENFIRVSVDGLISEAFMTNEGVKQGGVLSPFLFNFLMICLQSVET